MVDGSRGKLDEWIDRNIAIGSDQSLYDWDAFDEIVNGDVQWVATRLIKHLIESKSQLKMAVQNERTASDRCVALGAEVSSLKLANHGLRDSIRVISEQLKAWKPST